MFASKLPACVVAMEACCGAHFLGRTFQAQGHTVRLMSPEYVAPYVKAQKTDDRDAEAIAEAATRPTMRLVTLKTEAQLDLQVLHRARERLVAGRTRLTNQLRAVLLERGVILPKRRAPLSKRLDELMAGGTGDQRSSIPAAAGSPRRVGEPGSTDRGLRRRTRRAHPRGRAGKAVGHHSGRRRHQRHRAPGSGRRCLGLRQGTRPGRLARAHATPALHRRQDQAARDQQAREQVSADAIDPRRARRHDALCHQTHSDRVRGCGGCSPELIPMSSSWRWPPSWRGSPGRCCARAATSTIRSAGKSVCRPDQRQRQAERQGRARGLRR